MSSRGRLRMSLDRSCRGGKPQSCPRYWIVSRVIKQTLFRTPIRRCPEFLFFLGFESDFQGDYSYTSTRAAMEGDRCVRTAHLRALCSGLGASGGKSPGRYAGSCVAPSRPGPDHCPTLEV